MPDDDRLFVMPNVDNSIAIPNVIQWCVQSMVDDNLPRPNIVRLCVLSMGVDGIPRPTLFNPVYVVQG